MNFLYVLTNDRIQFRNIQVCIQNESIPNDKKVIFCYPVNDKSILLRLGIEENENILLDNLESWKIWMKRLIDELTDYNFEQEKELETEQQTEQEKNQEKFPETAREITQEENKTVEEKSSILETSLENIKFSIAEENTKLNQMLTKINSFKTNVMKIQNNLHSIKKYKMPTIQSNIPQVFASERPSRMTSAITLDECKKWLKNKSMNPKTNRKIETDGPTYKKFELMSQIYGLLN